MSDGLKYYLILRKGTVRASFAGSGQKAEVMEKTLTSRGFKVEEVSKDVFLKERDAT